MSSPDTTYLGIDPGVSGGIVAIRNGDILKALKLADANKYDVRKFIENITTESKGEVLACIERVGGFMGGEDAQGKKKNMASAHTMFVLGESYGMLDMVLVCYRISRKQVLPKEWQSLYGIKKDIGETQVKFKNRIKRIAERKYPGWHITRAISDASLLAFYCSKLTW